MSQHVCHSWRSQKRSIENMLFFLYTSCTLSDLSWSALLFLIRVLTSCLFPQGTGKGDNFQMELSQVGFSAHYSSQQVQSAALYTSKTFLSIVTKQLHVFFTLKLPKALQQKNVRGCALLWIQVKYDKQSPVWVSWLQGIELNSTRYVLNGILPALCAQMYFAKAVCWWMKTKVEPDYLESSHTVILWHFKFSSWKTLMHWSNIVKRESSHVYTTGHQCLLSKLWKYVVVTKYCWVTIFERKSFKIPYVTMVWSDSKAGHRTPPQKPSCCTNAAFSQKGKQKLHFSQQYIYSLSTFRICSVFTLYAFCGSQYIGCFKLLSL